MPKQNQITQRGLYWLKNTTSFYILHHFKQVCNLRNQLGEILSIQTANIALGPFSCQIDSTLFNQIHNNHSLHFKPNTAGFWIDGHFVSATDMPIWRSQPDWKRYKTPKSSSQSHPLSAEIEQHLQALLQALTTKKQTQIKQMAARLVGRGIGLTPTGDDILCGIIYALHVLQNQQELIKHIGDATIGGTTSLSAAFIQAAVAGEAIEPWHDIINGRPNAIEALWQIGHTSGRDAWIGFERTYHLLKTTSSVLS